jgi:Na+/pantothenate symporter
MNLSTLTGFVIFGINFDTFLIVTSIIIFILLVLGIILMVRNVRPITGFLLLILAIALVIGVAYDGKGIKRSLKNTYEKIMKN